MAFPKHCRSKAFSVAIPYAIAVPKRFSFGSGSVSEAPTMHKKVIDKECFVNNKLIKCKYLNVNILSNVGAGLGSSVGL